jgi:hypothetical protein
MLRRIPALFVLAAAVLVPWTLVEGYRLPARHTTHHWDVAWIGFDVALAVALAATGLGVVRRARWARTTAAIAATLLLTDAWFDNLLSDGVDEHLEAGLEAMFAEIPLAAACVWLARHPEQTVASVRSALDRRRN